MAIKIPNSLPWFENHSGNIYSATSNGAIFQPCRVDGDAANEERACFACHASNLYPELVKALADCVARITFITGDLPDDATPHYLINARALLAKCKGGE